MPKGQRNTNLNERPRVRIEVVMFKGKPILQICDKNISKSNIYIGLAKSKLILKYIDVIQSYVDNSGSRIGINDLGNSSLSTILGIDLSTDEDEDVKNKYERMFKEM